MTETNVGTCPWCHTGLVINVTMIAALEVFCPNAQCAQFAASYWIDRKSGREI